MKKMVAVSMVASLVAALAPALAAPAQAATSTPGGTILYELDTSVPGYAKKKGYTLNNNNEKVYTGDESFIDLFKVPDPITTGYQPLKYGQITTFNAGGTGAAAADNPPETRTVSGGEWGITNTVVGEKPSLVGVQVWFSSVCKLDGLSGDEPSYKCGPWLRSFAWDRLDLRVNQSGSVFQTNWALNGVDGLGYCPTEATSYAGGPFKPGSMPNVLAADPAQFMPASRESGAAYRASDYQSVEEAVQTVWGGIWANSGGGVFEDNYIVSTCYRGNDTTRASAAVEAFSSGRYYVSADLSGSYQRVYSLVGDSGSLSRAYLPSGTVVYKASTSVPGALTDPNAGRVGDKMSNLTWGNRHASLVASISCSDRGWNRRVDGVGQGGIIGLWNSTAWPDGGDVNYFAASRCATHAGAVTVPVSLLVPAAVTPPPGGGVSPLVPRVAAPAGGDPAAGVFGRCLVNDAPVVTAPDGIQTVGHGTVEVRSNNKVYGVDFGETDVYVDDAAGAGLAEDISRDPVRRESMFYFGGATKRLPPAAPNTVSPSLVNSERNLSEINTPEIQPYASQKFSSYLSGASVRGTWQNFNIWQDHGTSPFAAGLGIAFDEPSTSGNSFDIAEGYRLTGVFRMKTTTPGISGGNVTNSNGTPAMSLVPTTPSTSTAYITQTFECVSSNSSLRAVDVRAGAGR